MKTKMRVSKQILSILLCLAMLLTFIPITAYAARDNAPYAPTIIQEVVWSRNCIFANGTPITIEAAGSGTAVWYMDGETKKYVNPNGANGDDLSEWIIFGGSNNPDGMNFDTYVTMTGGKVKRIYAGIYSMGYLNGTAYVTVTGGTITGGIYCNTYLSSSEDKTKTVTIFDSTGASINLGRYGVADNVVQKNGSVWTVSGNGIIPEGVTVTVSEGETLTVPSDATLKNNGALVNGGGTITVYGNLSGNAPENYIAPKDFTFNTAELKANVPYTMSEAVCTTDNTTLSPWFTYGIENQGTTDAVLSERVITAKNEGTVTVKVTMHDGYCEPISKTFDFPVSSDIEKADQTAPAVSKTDETISAKKDGKITGVDSTMEYRKDGESTYTAITGTEVTGLGSGTYFVRYKETSNFHASPETEVTIAAGRKLTVKVPQNQVGYTMTTTTPEVDYFGSIHVEFKLHDGYSMTDDFQIYNGTEPMWQHFNQQTGVLQLNFVGNDFDFTVKGVADITPPTAEIKVKENSWLSLLNHLTFGLFFKETQDVTITATDNGSGVKSIEYYVANEDLIADSSLTDAAAVSKLENAVSDNWNDYNGEIALNMNAKYIIYAKITDNAGNISYISSDGIVLYTDSTSSDLEKTYTYTSMQDVEYQINFNGNTVYMVKFDSVFLNSAECIDTENGIKIRASYLETNSEGEHYITVYMSPLGEKFNYGIGYDKLPETTGDTPNTLTFVLKIKKLAGKVNITNDISKAYDGAAVEEPEYNANGNGEITVEYKPFGADDSAYSTEKPVKIGDYTVRVSVSESSTVTAASATANFSITKADQAAPVVNKVDETISGKNDGKITDVTDNMEYRADGAEAYTAITGEAIENLADGKYYVRVKGDSNHNASPEVEVIIATGRMLNVTFKADDQVVDTVETEYGKDVAAPEIPAKEGYTGKWDKDSKNITSDTEINAVYTINEYTITFMDENGVYKTVKVKHGEKVEMPEPPAKDGYTVKWEKVLNTITSDATVKAVYTEIPKSGASTSPNTGDNSSLWLWFALMFMSGTAIFGITLNYLKRNAASKG